MLAAAQVGFLIFLVAEVNPQPIAPFGAGQYNLKSQYIKVRFSEAFNFPLLSNRIQIRQECDP
jgi:hypothetical protein